MRRRQLQALLTTAAGLLLLLQIGLYGIVATIAPLPEALSAQGIVAPQRNPAPPLPAVSSERTAVQVLDRLLDQRLRSAAARENADFQALVPSDALREAALASPAPDGPAVQALIAHYGASLQILGETLDATSGG